MLLILNLRFLKLKLTHHTKSKFKQFDAFYLQFFRVVRTGWIINETCNDSKGLTDRERKLIFATADRHLLELSQISIKSNRIDRLVDLSRWCNNEKTIEAMIKLAAHHKLVAVVNEMEEVKMELFYKQQQQQQPTLPVISATKEVSKPIVSALKSNEMSVNESPSGILANLTPLKQHHSVLEPVVTNVISSPAELVASPTNPFAKENSQNEQPEPNNAMLDYISAMMNLNNTGKRKGTEELNNNGYKKSSLSK